MKTNTMKFDNLMICDLAANLGTEVVVSHVEIPAHTRLPTHWHPGEEFAYVLDGSFELQLEGEENVTYRKGDVGVVPLKRVHTVETHEEGASMVVFRVHESGEPERVLV